MNSHSKPLVSLGPEGLDEIAESLIRGEGLSSAPPAGLTPFPSGRATIKDPEKYLFLPARAHGSYSYPNSLISLERRHNGLNWHDTHKALAKDNDYMMTIRQFVDFVNLLKSGKAVDGRNQPIDSGIIQATLDDIFKLGNYRGRWFDADFKVKNDVLHIRYNHRFQGNSLIYDSAPIHPNTLMEDRKSGIDLADWLNRATEQGLPPRDVKQGDIWYYKPLSDDNSVARFVADSDGTYLGCYGVPIYSNASLGVHVARKI